MLSRSIFTSAAALTAGGLLALANAHAATVTASSSSNALSAAITINGSSSSLPNQEVASGTAPPKYSKTVSVPSFSKTQTLSGLTLSVTAQNIKDTASSAGLDAKGGVAVASGAAIGPLSSTLSAGSLTALTVGATKLVSSASFAKTKAGATTATGSTTITALTINSALFGINNLSYSGKPKPNFVLYHNTDNSVVVYLNRQTTASSGGKVSSLSVSTVNLHIKNYKYLTYTVSGDINVATSNAK